MQPELGMASRSEMGDIGLKIRAIGGDLLQISVTVEAVLVGDLSQVVFPLMLVMTSRAVELGMEAGPRLVVPGRGMALRALVS